MPIYEYQCDDCDHKLEALQKMSDEPLEECPTCGKPSLRKLVSAAAFRLKGSGWYETDFKDKSAQKNLSSPDDKSASKSDPTTSDSSDARKSEPTSSDSGAGKKSTEVKSTPATVSSDS